MPPRRSGNTLKSAQTVPGNQCSRPLKRVFADPLVLLVFVGVGGVYAKMVTGQEGPYPAAPGVHLGPPLVKALFAASQSRRALPNESSAPISEIFGVTHSNFSFFPTASSLLLSSRSAEVIISRAAGSRHLIHNTLHFLTQPCSTLQHPPTRPPNSPLQVHRHSRSTVGVRWRWSPSG